MPASPPSVRTPRASRAALAAALLVLVGSAGDGATAVPAAIADDLDARAAALLDTLTLEQKVAQLGAAFHHQLVRKGGAFPADADARFEHGLGAVSRLSAWGGRSAEEARELGRVIQRRLVEGAAADGGPGIAALIHEEALSGAAALGATVYPQSLSLAATFDPDLVREVADRIREDLLACGVRQALAPVLDVVRDPRWGRTEETFGEDPYLVAALGVAFVRGLQEGAPRAEGGIAELRDGVAATAKHFAGHGAAEGGRNAAPVHVGERELREVDLVPFEAAVAAGVRAVMGAYHARDGVPAAADRALLTAILRERWGFRGVVMSDYGSVGQLFEEHGVASNPLHAGVMALLAGVDVELPQVQCFGRNLVAAAEGGALPVAALDRAVLRVLRLKLELGLVDAPSREFSFPEGGLDGPARRALARRAAERGIVLLRNDGALPLPDDAASAPRIALLGPAADASLALVGDYAYPFVMGEAGGVSLPTIREALETALPGRVSFAPGSGLVDGDADGLADAASVAATCDVVVVALGDRVAKDASLSGEHRDRATLALPPGQAALLDVALASGRPVVAVLATGRPVAEPDRLLRCAAVVHLGFPGEEGAGALVDVLLGRASPSGRTPISWPRATGQIPMTYRRPATSRGPYVDDGLAWGSAVEPGDDDPSTTPLFPFGHGLSYARFAYRDLAIAPDTIAPDGVVEVGVTVENASARPADEVVQLYVSDLVATTTRPALELKGFQRVTVPPGGAVRVTFRLPADALALVDPGLRQVVEPGRFDVFVGRSSADLPLRGGFEISGRVREVGIGRAMFSEVRVEPVER